jgi:enoyl-[acyl-carrier protein] reductase/trans-2-enoyl-CoA reductase (NAD+)
MPVIKPMIRSNICINSHPAGCAAATERQIAKTRDYFASGNIAAPRLALVVGCSTGYGLASRIVAAFGAGAATVGLSFEKAGKPNRPGTPGFYNNLAFERAAKTANLLAETINIDAYSHAAKTAAIDAIKRVATAANIPAKVDLIIYSLASPVRTDPDTGVMYKSVIKPIGASYAGDTVDIMTGKISRMSVGSATDDEVAATIKVMGGEDWELWIAALDKAGVLAEDARTVAYTYLGPALSWPIYKDGTIGRAKSDLERAAKAINTAQGKATAFVSVNKAVVTRSSAVIPVIPLYVSCLFRVMREKGLHEGCLEQMARLFRERLYRADGVVPVDDAGRIRLDDREMQSDVQSAVEALMARVTEQNIEEITDVAHFRHDFLEVAGFDVSGVDYTADIPCDTI